MRAAAWALLGAALAAFGALVTDPVDSAFATVVTIALIVVAAVFGLAALVLAAIAGYQAATTPRVSFADSYAEGPRASANRPAAPLVRCDNRPMSARHRTVG